MNQFNPPPPSEPNKALLNASVKRSSLRINSSTLSSQRLIGGATAASESSITSNFIDNNVLSDGNNPLDEHVNIPPCPDDFYQLIENTSLERLVFWKLERLIDKLSYDLNNDIQINVLDKVVAHVEKSLFVLALRNTSGNLSNAAKLLGCNRNTLHKKLKEFNISPKDLRKFLRLNRIQRIASLSNKDSNV